MQRSGDAGKLVDIALYHYVGTNGTINTISTGGTMDKHSVRTEFTDEEFRQLRIAAAHANVSVREFVRRAALEALTRTEVKDGNA
jgi:hypothetical protein